MGSVFAAIAIVSAIVLVVLPQGTAAIFFATAAVLVALALAAVLRARPGLIAAATVIGGFSFFVAHPFSITRQELNSLNRAARGGDESAQALIDLFGALAPYATALMIAIGALVIVIFVIAARRSRNGAHNFMLDESDALATFCSRAGIAAGMLYLPMILVIVYDVLQRKYLDLDPGFTNTQWYRIFTSTRLQEMEWHLHAVLFLMCLGFAYVKDAHVRIELVRERLNPRPRIWIELLGCLLFLVPYCYVVVLYGTDFAERSFAILERSSAQTGLELRFIIKSFLPLGFMILALAGTSVALRCIVYLLGPQSLKAASGYFSGVHHADMPSEPNGERS
jgi:TRAP-type mannitol/chloroaromatic compound transport system permease small subunit